MTNDDYEVRGWSSGGCVLFCAFSSFHGSAYLRLELPSSEPLVGRSPSTRDSELGDRQWRRRSATDLAFVGELRGSSTRYAFHTCRRLNRKRLDDYSSCDHACRIEPAMPFTRGLSSFHANGFRLAFFPCRPHSLGRLGQAVCRSIPKADEAWGHTMLVVSADGLELCFV